MEKERIEYLYRQYLQQLATPLELAEWAGVLQDTELKSILDQVVDEGYYAIPETDLEEMEGNRSAEIYSYIIAQKVPGYTVANVRRLWPKIFTVAAAVALIVIGAILFKYKINYAGKDLTIAAAHILPGKQGATLTLATGKQITLNDVANGVLAKEAGVRIRKTAKGQLVYEIQNQSSTDLDKINTLKTARGETYAVILPDKSTVWLNAASSIKYPASFAGAKKRIVQLDGEAYFEVAKDKAHPFIVKTAKQEVTVLGTHFNINCYADNDATKTTLLEGRVAVHPAETGNGSRVISDSLILKPSQQSVLTGHSLKVLEVEPSDAIAWKNGYFMFDNEDLGSIMRTLSRWYDTNIVYEDETLKNELVFAKLSRYQNISKILKLMERTDKIKFKVDGNTITISRNQK